jgi:hypothetical protein
VPAVVSSSPTGTQPPGVTKVHVTFNEPILVSSFTTGSISAFTRNNNSILADLAGVVSTGGSTTSTDFDVTITGQGEALVGNYALTIGGPAVSSTITDPYGNPLAAPYTATFSVAVIPPAVTAFTPTGTNTPVQPKVHVTFNIPVLVSSFTTGSITAFTRNGTANDIRGDITGVVATNQTGSTATQFDITFASGEEFATGVYSMTLGPNITDPFGNAMTSAYTATFNIDGPQVTALTPSSFTAPISSETVTFSRAMDASTFTLSQITVTGPGGVAVAVGSITPATGSATTFTITFAKPLTAAGTYTTVIGPNVQDTFGNAMDQNGNFVAGENPGDKFTGTWATFGTIGPDAFGYIATLTTYQNLDIVGQPGTFTVIASGDDTTATIDLGSNTFNLYGQVYSTLYVSSNGLISLNRPDSRFRSQDLTTDPNEPLIAPLWDDWFKSTGTTPMVVAQFRDYVNGQPTHLVIEWNQIEHFPFSRPITFEVELDLNTGRNTAKVLFNYQDIDAQSGSPDSLGASVGIKDSGNQSGTNDVLQVSFHQASPLVGSGKAILFIAPPFGPTIRGIISHDLNPHGALNGLGAVLPGYETALFNGAVPSIEGSGSSPSLVWVMPGGSGFTSVAGGDGLEALLPGDDQPANGNAILSAPAAASPSAIGADLPAVDHFFSGARSAANVLGGELRRTLSSHGPDGDLLSNLLVEELLARLMPIG